MVGLQQYDWVDDLKAFWRKHDGKTGTIEYLEVMNGKPLGRNIQALPWQAHLWIIVEYILCLSGSNAPAELVSSLMKKFLKAEETQLSVPILKAIIITKMNRANTC